MAENRELSKTTFDINCACSLNMRWTRVCFNSFACHTNGNSNPNDGDKVEREKELLQVVLEKTNDLENLQMRREATEALPHAPKNNAVYPSVFFFTFSVTGVVFTCVLRTALFSKIHIHSGKNHTKKKYSGNERSHFSRAWKNKNKL